MLVGGVRGLAFKTETLAGQFAVERQLSHYYGIDAEFDIQLVYGYGSGADRSQWIVNEEYPRYVLPHAGLVHTRDPLIAVECAKRRINYIWEHHGEDYQTTFTDYAALHMKQPFCRAIVAITAAVRHDLLNAGVPRDKCIVLDSGVNGKAAEVRREAAIRWRRFFLDDHYSGLACYSGGMQRERGIGHILDSAEKMPDKCFVLLGGHASDLAIWKREISARELTNVRLPGYQPHSVVCEIQQAADVLLLTRAAGGRPNVTSPLKFFEYLASGTPIIAGHIGALNSFSQQRLDVRWYDPASPHDLTVALKAHFELGRAWPSRSDINIETGLCYTWAARQRRLLDFIGAVEPKRTF